MAAPNLKNPTTITGRTARYAVTAIDISVSVYDGSADRYIAYTISVPADATQVLSTKETYFYLEEGDSIRAIAGAASRLQLVIGYEDIS